MLTHRNILILFSVLLILLVLLNRTYALHWSLYLFLFLVFISIEFYGAYFIHSGFHLKATCKADTSEKIIALTFDDGPVQQTEKVLDTLDNFDARATFFCIGNRIRGNERILQEIHNRGHILANHSHTHGYLFDLKTTHSFITDIERCSNEIERVSGKKTAFFRPPYGVTTPGLARAIKKLNLTTIGWNIRSLDTSIKNKNKILSRIRKGLQPGSILLMHDTVPGIEIVLKDVLLLLKEQNYKVVPLDELIQKQAYV